MRRGGRCDNVWRRGRQLKGCMTSCASHLRQGLARESWMIALVHIGLHGIALMVHATDIAVQPVFPPTTTGTDGRAPWIIQKIWVVFETHIDLYNILQTAKRDRGYVIFEGVQSTVTKRDKEERGFFPENCVTLFMGNFHEHVKENELWWLLLYLQLLTDNKISNF